MKTSNPVSQKSNMEA